MSLRHLWQCTKLKIPITFLSFKHNLSPFYSFFCQNDFLVTKKLKRRFSKHKNNIFFNVSFSIFLFNNLMINHNLTQTHTHSFSSCSHIHLYIQLIDVFWHTSPNPSKISTFEIWRIMGRMHHNSQALFARLTNLIIICFNLSALNTDTDISYLLPPITNSFSLFKSFLLQTHLYLLCFTFMAVMFIVYHI